MRKATFLAAAQADLVNILVYITESSGSLAIAQAFVQQLRAQCHKLAGLPGTLGQARPELRPDIRSFSYRNYVLFFRYVDDRFEVVNILHAHRDIEGHFTAAHGDEP